MHSTDKRDKSNKSDSFYDITNEESIRINIVKFIAIIFVVFIHSYTVDANFSEGTINFNLPLWLKMIEEGISQVIARCGVPIFFLVSAVLLFKKERSYSKTLKNKIKTLLIPYVFWNSLWILIFLVLQSLPFTSSYFSGTHKPILECSFYDWLDLYGIGLHYPHDYPLWFMRDLMVVILFFPLIKWITNLFPKIVMASGVILIYSPLNIPFKTAIAFFLIGCAIVKLDIHFTALDKFPLWYFVVTYGIMFIISLINDNSYSRNTFIFIGIIFWFRMSKEIYDNERFKNIFMKLSEWTFMIYVFHEMTLSSVRKICLKLLPANHIILLVEYFAIPFLVVLICILVGYFMKKCIFKFYTIVTGER